MAEAEGGILGAVETGLSIIEKVCAFGSLVCPLLGVPAAALKGLQLAGELAGYAEKGIPIADDIIDFVHGHAVAGTLTEAHVDDARAQLAQRLAGPQHQGRGGVAVSG